MARNRRRGDDDLSVGGEPASPRGAAQIRRPRAENDPVDPRTEDGSNGSVRARPRFVRSSGPPIDTTASTMPVTLEGPPDDFSTNGGNGDGDSTGPIPDDIDLLWAVTAPEPIGPDETATEGAQSAVDAPAKVDVPDVVAPRVARSGPHAFFEPSRPPDVDGERAAPFVSRIGLPPVVPSTPPQIGNVPTAVPLAPEPSITSAPTSVPYRRDAPKVVRLPRRPRVRRVSRVVRSIDAWTVFKVSVVFYIAMYVVFLVAGVLLWNVAYNTGTIDNISNFFESFGWKNFEFNGGEIYHNAWIIGLFVVAALTGLNVVLATLYNLITDLVGGIRLTVLEEEVLVRQAGSEPSTGPRTGATATVKASRRRRIG